MFWGSVIVMLLSLILAVMVLISVVLGCCVIVAIPVCCLRLSCVVGI